MIAEPPIPDPVIPDPVTPAPAADPEPAPTIDQPSVPPNLSFAPLSCEVSPPSLTSRDRTLLYTYLQLNENLAALAAHLAANPLPTAPERPDADGLPPAVPCPLSTVPSDYFSLLTWLNQPHIQQALESHDHAVARNDRRVALEALRKALETADNPTNLRRAATTLLRSTIVRTSALPPPRDGSSPPSPRGTRGEVSGGSATDGEGGCLPSHSVPSCLSALVPLPPLPPPTSRPAPTADAATTFKHIAAALTAPQLPVALSTLHAYATPDATFAAHPIPTDPTTWPDTLPQILPKHFKLPLEISNPKEVERTAPPIQNPQSKIQNLATSRWHFWHRATSAIFFECALTLTRAPGEHADRCWRLTSFDILRQSG